MESTVSVNAAHDHWMGRQVALLVACAVGGVALGFCLRGGQAALLAPLTLVPVFVSMGSQYRLFVCLAGNACSG